MVHLVILNGVHIFVQVLFCITTLASVSAGGHYA